MTPEAVHQNHSIRSGVIQGSTVHLNTRQNLLTGEHEAAGLASWDTCRRGNEQSLLLRVWLLEVTFEEEALMQGLLPALTCKMSLL